jgi:hypothetical protein
MVLLLVKLAIHVLFSQLKSIGPKSNLAFLQFILELLTISVSLVSDIN